MSDKWLAALLIAAALVFSAGDFIHFYGRLPPQVASHFDFQGNPNGWSSKQEFIGAAVAANAILVIAIVPIALYIRHMPLGLVNLPNKLYWTAPERVDETMSYISQWLLWFGAATLWLMAIVFHKSYLANLRQPAQLHGMWPLMLIYSVVVGYLLVQMILRFRLPANTRSAA